MQSYEKPNYLKFDTIEFITKIDYFKREILTFNDSKNPRNGNITGKYYSSKNDSFKIPFTLNIGVSYTRQSMKIKFSSKILGDDYPKLITKDTFRQCLENLNKLGICEIDIDGIMKYCYFKSIHVTTDFPMELTNEKLNTLNILGNNSMRYKWQHYETSGITFNRDVKDEDSMDSFKIYNKEKEIDKSENKKFLSQLEDPDRVKEYFKENNTRFEIVLKDKKIKKYFDIQDTHIDNVFNSKTNPILLVFNNIFGTEELKTDLPRKYSPDEWFMKNTLIMYNHDIKKIKMELRNCYGSRKIDNRIKKLKELSKRILDESPNNSTVLADIRKKLEGQ